MAGYFSYFSTRDYTLTDEMQKKLVDISQYSTIFSKIADDLSFYSYYTMKDGERLDTVSQNLYGTPEYYWTIPLINGDMINVFEKTPKDYNTFLQYLAKKYPGVALKLQTGQTLAGKFEIGETVVYNSTNRGKVLGKFPTNGYLQIEVTQGSFPMNNNAFTVTGLTSGDSAVFINTVPTYEAPAYHTNSNGNQTRWNAGQVTPTLIREVELEANIESSQIKVIRPRYIYDIAQQFEREMNNTQNVEE